jgi:hypothetical protein
MMWSNERFSIITTTTWSMPEWAGLGSAAGAVSAARAMPASGPAPPAAAAAAAPMSLRRESGWSQAGTRRAYRPGYRPATHPRRTTWLERGGQIYWDVSPT